MYHISFCKGALGNVHSQLMHIHVHCIFAFFADKVNEVIKISIYTTLVQNIMFGMYTISAVTALSFMLCVKFLKNHFSVCKRRGFRLFRFVADNFCLRTSCNIHCHCLQDTSARGRHFH